MYDDQVLRIPKDETELRDLLREQFDYVTHDLLTLQVETKEDALGDRLHFRTPKDRVVRDGLHIIRYLGVSDEFDQRLHFLEMGRSVISYIDKALDEERLTPEFVQQWGKLMFCHGFIVAHISNDSDALAQTRGGEKRGKQVSRDAQREWLPRMLIPLMDGGATRDEAEARVARYIEELLKSGSFPAGFDRSWLAPILTRGELAATYDYKHFSKKETKRLIIEGNNEIPPLPSKVP